MHGLLMSRRGAPWEQGSLRDAMDDERQHETTSTVGEGLRWRVVGHMVTGPLHSLGGVLVQVLPDRALRAGRTCRVLRKVLP